MWTFCFSPKDRFFLFFFQFFRIFCDYDQNLVKVCVDGREREEKGAGDWSANQEREFRVETIGLARMAPDGVKMRSGCRIFRGGGLNDAEINPKSHKF